MLPQTKELQFTYIPSGAEIISIDAFNHSPVTDDFVIGITIIKSAETGSPGQFLNIYSDWEHGNDLELENLAQVMMMILMMVMMMTMMIMMMTRPASRSSWTTSPTS